MFEIAGGILLAVFVLVLLIGKLSAAHDKPGAKAPPLTPPDKWERPDLRSDWQKRKDAAEQAALRR